MFGPLRKRLARSIVVLAIAASALTLGTSVASAGYLPTHGPIGGGVIKLAGPDLVVSSINQGYSSYYGWYTDATISNQGSGDAGSFFVQNGATYYPVSSLGVGASVTVRFYRGSQCEAGGTVTADATNQVWELNEGNNSRPWSIIC